MLTFIVMFPKVSYIRPFLQLIKAFDVARKGLPRMKGVLLIPLVDCSMSSTTKSMG